MRPLPRVMFVLGKGGVGRSTVAAALGFELARRGERTCVFGWTVDRSDQPWFGLPPADLMPREVLPRLSVANYRLDQTLALYFVEHLHLPRFYRHVIDGVHVRKLIEAAPGIAEVFFVGHLWWLTTLAEKEAGLAFDRIVVDAPATGHGASLLDMPAVLAALHGTGLVGVETERVVTMMSDPSWTGALVVTLAEELSVEETMELVPRVSSRLARPPLALFVNRSVVHALGSEPAIALESFGARLSPRGARVRRHRSRRAPVARALRARGPQRARRRDRARHRLARRTTDGTRRARAARRGARHRAPSRRVVGRVVSARLHVLLGDGGVGKTTLAAGYALALAERGRHVALLGIDPARRLQSALGLSLEHGVARVPVAGDLHAALLLPEATLRRWATEGIRDPHERDRLLQNRLFAVLADRLAATTDVIAAVRIAEWLESDPHLTDLVVDTAPGRNGIEFLERPAALLGLMKGRLLGWLRRADEGGIARRILRGLSHVGGVELLGELGELATSVQRPFQRVLDRLEHAQAALRDPATEILLVTAVREDAVHSTEALRAELAAIGHPPSVVVVNRVLSSALRAESAHVDETSLDAPSSALLRYLRAYDAIQARVVAGANALAPSIVTLAAVSGLDGDARLARLTSLGACLCEGIGTQAVHPAASLATGETRNA